MAAFSVQANQHLKNIIGGVSQDIAAKLVIALTIQILKPFVSLVVVEKYVVILFFLLRGVSRSTWSPAPAVAVVWAVPGMGDYDKSGHLGGSVELMIFGGMPYAF